MFLQLPTKLSRQSKTSDLIIASFGEIGRCSAKDLHHHLVQQYRIRISYQAVHKLVKALYREEILGCHDKQYELNRGWLLSAKAIIDKFLSGQVDGAKFIPSEFRKTLTNNNVWTFDLPTLYEADCFWGEVAYELCVNPSYKISSRDYYAFDKYAWYMPMNVGRETKLFASLLERGFRVTFLMEKRSKLNDWSAGIYLKSGVSVIRVQGLPSDEYFNVIGDVVMSVQFSRQAQKLISELVHGNPSVKQLRYDRIFELAHRPAPVRLVVQRNQVFADGLLARYEMAAKMKKVGSE